MITTRAVAGLRHIAAYRAATQLFTWIVTVIVVRLLSPSDYGLVAMAGIATNLAAVFDDAGLGAALVQRRHVSSTLCHGVFSIAAGISILILAVLWLVAEPLAAVMSEPDVARIVKVAAFSVAINVLGSPARALMARHSRFALLGAVDLAAAIAASLTSVVLAFNGFGFWALVIAGVLQASIRSLLFIWLMPCRLRLSIKNFALVLPLIGFGARVSMARLLGYAADNLDKALVGKILGTTVLGSYSVGQQFARIPLDKATSVLAQVAYPAFSRLSAKKGGGRRELVKLLSVNTALFLPLMWLVAIFGISLVPVVLGSHWASASVAFAGFAAIVPFQMIRVLITSAVMASGRTDIIMGNAVINLVGSLGGLSIGIRFGLAGAVLGFVSGWMMGWLWTIVRSSKCLDVPLGEVGRLVVVPGICAVSAAGLVATFFGGRDVMDQPTLGALGGAISIVLAYGFVWIVDRSTAMAVFDSMWRVLFRPRPERDAASSSNGI